MNPVRANNTQDASDAFAALGAPQRLDLVLRLVRAGPRGMATGRLATAAGLPASTLSHHLRALSDAGLVKQTRQGRSLICTVDFDRIRGLADYLLAECCRDAEASDAHEDHSR